MVANYLLSGKETMSPSRFVAPTEKQEKPPLLKSTFSKKQCGTVEHKIILSA